MLSISRRSCEPGTTRVAPFSRGEIGERPHGRDLELDARNADRIEIVVPVQVLRPLAGHDLDRSGGADAVVLAMAFQDVVGDAHHKGMGQKIGRRPRQSKYAAQPPRLVPVEIVREFQALLVERGA